MAEVELVYCAQDGQQESVSVPLSEALCVGTAIEQSGLLTRFPEIDLQRNAIGIYGNIVTLDTILKDGDRIEIYRPLQKSALQQRRDKLKTP